MPLTDTAVRNLKPSEASRKVADERGLYLQIEPSGGRYWRLKYRFLGKEKKLALGVYPDVSLKLAREKRDEARQQLAKGIDPGAEKRRAKLTATTAAGNSFELVAREWFSKRSQTWAPSHSERVVARLERDVFPHLGARPIADITAPELLAVIRRIEARVVETAHRALRDCGQIMRFGIATGRCSRDCAADLRGALAPFQKKHFAATLEAKRLGQMLRLMDHYAGTSIVASALRLAPMLFARPGELRHAEWSAVDLEQAEWRYVSSKTKTDHIVPLPTQALAILRELQPVTGRSKFVFPSARDPKRPMSDNAVLVAMRSLEIGKDEMTGHGFRAVARTLLDEVLGFRPDIIEQQLAHNVRDPNGRAYNRTKHLDERRRMMQAWADHLDHLKRQVLVMPARREA